ncbi:MAG: DUF11 domain-containing protein [Arcicella sp.]|nr:DUF11 domain-containing protein [Arcicella sp.]
MKEYKFLFIKDLFNKLKQLFSHRENIKSIVELLITEESMNDSHLHPIKEKYAVVETYISVGVIREKSHILHTNYQINNQQMNLFTYLRRAITSSEEALCGRFLGLFKNFLSVIVCAAPKKNDLLGLIIRVSGILSNLDGSKLLSSNVFNQQAMCSWVSVLFLTFLTSFETLAQSSSVGLTAFTDLSIKKTISTQNPTISQDVTYTIKVRNDGIIKATGVEITDILPIGVTLKTVSVGGIGSTSNSTTAGITTIIWNVGEVSAAPTELTMIIVATVVKRGLWFNTAEITKEIEVDIDSSPNNHDINEDDQDAVCFSIEDYFYKGDEFITALPTGYTNVIWTKKVGNGVPTAVTATTPGVVLLNDGSGNIKITDITSYTEFTFSANNKNCPITGCCPIKFIYGPLGSIGDFVFSDNNKDGIQNTGDTPIPGIKVILYKADGITKVDSAITDVNGKYLFASLQTDNYKVKFIIPAGKTFSPTGAGTPSTSSVAGTDGFSPIIPIDVEGTGKAKDNLDIDAGIITNCNINVGTLTTNTPNFCLPTGGSVVLSATTTVPPIIPTGYSIKYVLTKGADLVIQQIANTPTFNLTSTGEYRIHTLVYDGNSANGSYLDLSTIVLGTTKGVDLISYIVQKSICAVLDATGVKFNVNPNPDSPVIAGATICAGSKVILGDKGPILLGISYAWFSSATAITPFAITQSIEVSPAVTTTYYVETTLVVPGACTSKRGSVTITVNPKPENPITKSSIANDCSKNLQTVNLADAIPAISSGSTIEWHVANDVASAIITNTTTVGAGTYYAFAKSTAGCYSGGVSVTVNINPCPCIEPAIVAVPVIPSVCGNTTPIQLKAVVGGSASGGTWTSNGTGIFDNAAILTAKYTPSAADVLKGSVEFTFTTNDPDGVCIAALAKTTLVFKAKPIAPENLRCNQVICLGDSNKLFSVSQGNIVKWYATATSSLPLGIVNNAEGFVVSPSAEGTYTYYADATTPDGCVSERSSISFIVKNCLTDLVVIKKIYTPDGITTPDYLLGQTATYSIEAQNIGTTNATDVKVNDILPAGATYVSSIPTGEYNNITGVWAIGSLTKGSTKALLIQVKLNKIGMVVNTAEISGNNEDPTKKNNNKSTVTIKVVEIADLSLRKTVNKTEVNIGDEVQYTITVLNSGPNTATNVEIKDKLPVGLTYISSSTLIESAGVLTGLAASIAKGATAVFTFKAKVNTPGKITNLAEVTKSDQKDPNSTPGNASVKHEDDDDSIYINSTPVCNIEKPTIACGCTLKTICLGGEVTLTASGCVGSAEYVWSNGGSTNSITVSPKTNQTYVVYCKKDSCKSESSNAVEVKVIIVDSPLLSASPSKICAGESITLTASGCSGVVEWQTSPKQTGPQITVKPTVSETYKAVCKEYDCISSLASVDVIVTPKPNPPLIVCQKGEICPGETISMTAMNCNGQVKWSTGQETTTITVFPIVTTSYTATCSVNGCTSGNSAPFILTVKPIAIPTIKITNLVVCTGGSSTLTAGGCTGKVTWYYDSKTLTGATIIVKPTTTTYYATCSSIVCSSDKSLPVTVQVANPGPPIVSSGTSTICLGSTVQLTATGCETGIVTWSDGQKGVVVTVKPLVSTSYTATCSIGACVSDNSIKRDITVTDFAKPTITANKSEICVGNSVTLTANGCNGTVKWSDGVTGSPRTVTPTADVKYTATCESSTCKSDLSNELTIKVNTAGPAPVVSCLKTELCVGESVTLSVTGCTGTVKWSDGSTGTTVTLKPSVTTTYSATCTTGTCESPKSNEKTITVKPTVVLNLTASASNATICVGAETTLTLAGCTGIITWTGGLTSPSIKVKPTETTTYTATCTGVACATDASASVKVTVLPGATTPNITLTNAQICVGADVTLTANNCNGALLWSNGATTASITVKPSITTIYSVKCTVDGCGEAKTSLPVTVQVGAPDAPIITSVPQIVCAGGSVILTATGCSSGTVLWSNSKTGVTITEVVNSTTTYSAFCKQGTCNSPESNKVTVTVTVPSVPTISCATSTICAGSTITLYATGCEGTVKWSDGQTGAIITVTPSKTTDYTATCSIGTCTSIASSVATVNVGNPPAPQITCNATSICQGIQVTLTATNCSGTIIWNDGQVGNVITAKPNATTTYTAICKLDNCESGKSNPVTVTVGAGIKTPTTKNLNNVCPFLTVDLASGVTSALSAGGIFEYHTGVLPTSPLVSSPNAVTTGTYYVFEKTGTGCYSLPGVINTYISTDCTPKDCTKMPVTVSAGADTTICAEKIYKLSGTFGGAATSITWKTTGTGSFDNPLSPTATYRSSLADVLAGTVKLIICTNDPDGNGPCLAKADTMVLTMNGVKFKPLITVTGNLNSCGSDSVTLTATAGYNYMWFEVGASTTTPFARTRSVVIKSSGSYYFKLVDPNKCCSIQSDTAIVNYLTIPIAPVANSVKIDRGTTVDLNKLIVSNLPTGATLVFKTGASSGSTTIANPSAVGAGVYYTFYKNAQGCFSVSTKITVENKDGNGSSVSDADLQITIKTDKVTYAKGDTVITTITVMNFGLGTAKGITLSSIIPSTLTYVSQTGGLVKLGSLLTGTLDSLVKDGVKVYIYKSVLNTKTETVVAVGGTTTTKDPNPSNNNGTGSFGTVTVNKGDVDNSVADVAIVMTSDKTTAKVGDNVNFLLSLTNNGPATAKQVVLTNSIPVGMTFVSSSTGQVLTGGSIIISLDSLQKGQVKTYAYVAIMNVKTTVTNTVIVTSLKDNIASNNASFVIINGDTAAIAKDEAELALLLTADKQLIVKGDVVTFTIKVTNNGPKVATNIVVDNILPKYLTFQSGDPLQKGDTLRVETTSITLGSTVTYTYKAKVNKDTIIINTAKITKTSPIDPILANNVSTVVLVPASDTTYADLGVVIVANKLTYKVGENVTYTVSLTNNGAGISKNVQLCNPLPSGLTYVSGTGVIKAGDSVTIKVDTISKGNTRTFTYIIKATTVGKIANTVRICNSSKVDLITPNNTSVSSITVIKDSVLVPPICNINLTMAIIDTAKVSDGVYNVTYRLIAKNACKDTLKNVTFTNNVANIFKTPVTVEILGKPNTGVSTNLIINDLFSKTDSNLVKVGSYMLPNASDTVKYVLKITLSGNKGPFFSDAAIKGKTTSNENLRAKAKEVLRFDLQNTRIGLAKEVLIIALKNDSTTYWTVPYRIRVVNMGINAITKLSVKDSLDAVFTVKGAKIIGIPIIIATPGLTVNKKFTGSGLFTDLLVPDSSSLAKGDTAIIDLTVRVNTATSTDTEKIYNNVAIGTATGTDLLIYKDISTNGQNPDANGDKDPSNDNVATPVKLNDVSSGTKEVSIGLALASSSDTITLADSTCNVTLIMTAKNYGTGNLTKVRLCTNLGNTIGKQSESWKLIGTPVVIKGNAKISKTFNGTTDSTITRSDSTFLAVGDSIVVMYLVNIRRPVNSTIFTQAIAKAVSALDSTKSTFDISTNGLNPDVNGDGNPDEAAQTPIYCKGVPIVGVDSTLFIPKGFSPNGDGINDGFVIGGIKLGEKVELMVFNRWGSVVYANQDYKNDWKGETNTGVRVLGNGQGLPDGTYYYMVTRFKATGEKVDAAPFVRYFTILR